MQSNGTERHEGMLVWEGAHLATIVALSTGVLQGIKGDLWVLVQEHLELACADAQVILVELIWDVPANGTKLAPFLHAHYMLLHHGSRCCYAFGQTIVKPYIKLPSLNALAAQTSKNDSCTCSDEHGLCHHHLLFVWWSTIRHAGGSGNMQFIVGTNYSISFVCNMHICVDQQCSPAQWSGRWPGQTAAYETRSCWSSHQRSLGWRMGLRGRCEAGQP